MGFIGAVVRATCRKVRFVHGMVKVVLGAVFLAAEVVVHERGWLETWYAHTHLCAAPVDTLRRICAAPSCAPCSVTISTAPVITDGATPRFCTVVLASKGRDGRRRSS